MKNLMKIIIVLNVKKPSVLCVRNACMMPRKNECVNIVMKIIVKSAVTIQAKVFMACVETVCHEQQNITSNIVFNMFLWLVLNHKNFEHHHMHDCAKKLAKTEAVKNLCDCF